MKEEVKIEGMEVDEEISKRKIDRIVKEGERSREGVLTKQEEGQMENRVEEKEEKESR